MDITTQIQVLIEALKNQPNSLPRNKAVSALENARVWSKEIPADLAGKQNTQVASHNQSGCNCELGVRRDCPIHAKQ